MTPKAKKAVKALVSSFFKNSNGKPYELTDSQCEIFESITNPVYKWVWVSAPTRYGKTEVTALSVIYLAVFHPLKVPIVAGSKAKAEKIMEYVVAHISDHPDLYAGLINTDISKIEKLKVSVSKVGLRWSSGFLIN